MRTLRQVLQRSIMPGQPRAVQVYKLEMPHVIRQINLNVATTIEGEQTLVGPTLLNLRRKL